MLPTVLAGIKHGSHLCAFYETKDDLIDLVFPFFAAGAARGDFCVWLMPDPVSAEEAALHAKSAVTEGGIELFRARDLYLRELHFHPEPVASFWNAKLQQTLEAGRTGLRASGDAFWLQPADWNSFVDYEADLNRMIADTEIALLCTYPLSISKSGDIFDVACAHQIAISKRKSRWEVIKGWCAGAAPAEGEQKRLDALDAAHRVLSLSPRERQVLDKLTEGRTSKEIGQAIGISARTVDVHRSRLLHRLNVRTIAEAVRLATLAHLIVQE